MLENVYTTKMSTDRKKLQNRFSKIRSRNGRMAKLLAMILFAAILIAMACVTIMIAARVNDDEYAMTENEFSDYINRPFGAVMADIDYADDNKLVFHYDSGLFVIKQQTGEIQLMMSLPGFNVSQHQQGSNILDVKIDKGGTYAYLSSIGPADEIKDFEEYSINLDNGEVKKGAMPENTELFAGIADTFTTVESPIGWYSNNCIINGDKTYYLTSETGTVNGLALVTVNRSDNTIAMRYVFGAGFVSEAQEIKEFSPSDIKDIKDVELVAGGVTYSLRDRANLADIEKAFSSAEKIGATGCSFTAGLVVFTRNDGEKGTVTLATDSCAVFKSGEAYYDYSVGDNSDFLGYFGLDVEKLHALLYLSEPASATAVPYINAFFDAFSASDLAAMKTLVTDDFIDAGYFGDHGMCYGMTSAQLQAIEETDAEEFLENYLARPEQTRLTLSESDIATLQSKSDAMLVYTVEVTAEHNIKGEIKPPFTRIFNVICKKQDDGGYLIHKLDS